MSWGVAKSVCRNVQAELISFRHQNIISLIYNATSKIPPFGHVNKLTGWTSAHATGVSGCKL